MPADGVKGLVTDDVFHGAGIGGGCLVEAEPLSIFSEPCGVHSFEAIFGPDGQSRETVT